MRRFLIFVLLLYANFAGTFAKTTYIPKYFSQVKITGQLGEYTDSSVVREYLYNNGSEFSIIVVQDSVTKERVKSIKRAKSAAGWSAAAAVFSTLSASLNPLNTRNDIRTYINSRMSVPSASFLSMCETEEAEKLQRVNISVVFSNNSDIEITVNDMNRGLIWFVPAHSDLVLDVGNPEINDFRIANNDLSNQNISYVTIQAGNFLDKYGIAYEDENYWVINTRGKRKTYLPEAQEKFEEMITGYVFKNKTTMEEKYYDLKEGKALIKELKNM